MQPVPVIQKAISLLRRVDVAVLLVIGSFAGASLVHAGDWELTESESFRLTFRDRDNQGSADESDMVTQWSPSLSISGTGGRSSANFSYSPTLSHHTNASEDLVFSHSLNATGRLEAYEDVFFLSGSARAGLIGLSNSSAAVDSASDSNELVQTYGFTLGPEFRHHLGPYMDIVSNNLLTYAGSAKATSSDSWSESWNLGITSGRKFTLFGWNLSATTSKTHFDSRTDENEQIDGGISYRFSNSLRGRANIGYQDAKVQTSRDDTSGATWDLGFDWTPNPRTSASLTYGERYQGETWSASFNHRSRKTNFGINASKSITNRRQQFTDPVRVYFDDGNPADFGTIGFFTDINTNITYLLDVNSGDLVGFIDTAVRQTDEDYESTTVGFFASVQGRRGSVTLSGSSTENIFEVVGDEQKLSRINLTTTRQLYANISATAGIGYRKSEQSVGIDSDGYDLNLSLSRSLGRKSSASVTFQHQVEDDDAGTGFTENRLSLTFNTSFL